MHRHTTTGWLLATATVLLLTLATVSVAVAGADHVRWDIVSIAPLPVPPITPATTFYPGGVAFAKADPYGLTIKLTGAGTFVAPASGGTSSAVTGGGTWETFTGSTSTGSGTYWVTKLVSWEFANLQTVLIQDTIGDTNERANGTAVLKIEFSDGAIGTMVVGCHGPGAPAGIFEGVTVTKGYVTYWNPPAPVPTVDANRTLFHVRQ